MPDYYEFRRDNFLISNNPELLDIDVIHNFLAYSSYWAKGLKKERLQRAIDHCFCFGLYTDNRQIGFARVLSDLSSIAYLMDVFVLEQYRGKGLGKWLVEKVLDYPEFKPVRRWMLGTSDAHSLYEKYGFTPYSPMAELMMRYNPNKFFEDED
ncbi:GNAT family N-acetyltransferase [bacterium]|nr:GNAT family N-acetyltransferase [bacterium]